MLWTRQRFLKLAGLGSLGVAAITVFNYFKRDNLSSDRRIDYTRLRDFLKERDWIGADKETRNLLQQIIGRDIGKDWSSGKYNEVKFKQDIDAFPCTDLDTIDQLWMKYSGNRFGFSVQKKIYLEFGGIIDGELHETEWDKLRVRVGWAAINDNYDDATFNISAPEGHLPICWWFGGLSFSRIALRLETCKNAA